MWFDRALEVCIQYWQQEGYTVVACVKNNMLDERLRGSRASFDNFEIVRRLQVSKSLVKIPNEQGNKSLDDEFAIAMAMKRNAMLISNDNFKDHYRDETGAITKPE